MTVCQSPRHDPPVPAEPHAVLCRPCKAQLARDLRRLPGLDAALEHLLVTHRPGARGDGQGLPVNEPVSDCRSQIRHDLLWWTRHVAGEREATPPEPSVLAWCGWLAGQVQWASFRPWVADMAAAIASDRGRAVALLDPWIMARITIPRGWNVCPACMVPGGLTATVYKFEDDRRPSVVECGGCGQRWEPWQWQGLGRRILQRAAKVPT